MGGKAEAHAYFGGGGKARRSEILGGVMGLVAS